MSIYYDRRGAWVLDLVGPAILIVLCVALAFFFFLMATFLEQKRTKSARQDAVPSSLQEEKKESQSEGREFQLEMLRVQLFSDFVNSFFTVIIALGFSWIGAMVAISFMPDIPPESKIPVVVSAVNMLILVMICMFLLIGISLFYIQKRLIPKLKKQFIPKKEEARAV